MSYTRAHGYSDPGHVSSALKMYYYPQNASSLVTKATGELFVFLN